MSFLLSNEYRSNESGDPSPRGGAALVLTLKLVEVSTLLNVFVCSAKVVGLSLILVKLFSQNNL